ncbi:MAG: cupin domain-containing protein [Deltaproteobacteria bacterium]|nr:cupin domain-containing protein [Deltaproteobacteria bacterium]
MNAFVFSLLLLAAPAGGPVLVVTGSGVAPLPVAAGKGTVKILLEQATGAPVSLSEMVLQPGAVVPEHAHEGAAEILYVVDGALDVTSGGKTTRAAAGDAVHVPPGVKHQAVVPPGKPVRLVQVYSPPGPEQRFRPAAAPR